MFKSFTVKNFRGFKDVTVESLSCINLIAGKNNVGKTALLEAIFLLLGSTNPSLLFAVDSKRNIEKTSIDIEEIFGWFFYDHQVNLPIQFQAQDDSNNIHTLVITLETEEKTQLQSKSDDTANSPVFSNFSSNKILKYSYSKSDTKEKIEKKLRLRQNGIEIDNPGPMNFGLSSYLPSNNRMRQQEAAQLFSKLEIAGQHLEIIEPLRLIEPRLKRLSVATSAGGITSIVADLGYKRLFPINYMGDGINQLLSILLTIATVREKGFLLIDEIENGFHYSVMPKIWEVILNLAKRFETTVIATTHSLECIKAAYSSCNKINSDVLSLYRLDRIDSEIKIINYDKEDLETSFNLNWEVR